MWEVGVEDGAEAPSEPEQKKERGDPEGLLYKEGDMARVPREHSLLSGNRNHSVTPGCCCCCVLVGPGKACWCKCLPAKGGFSQKTPP